MSDTIFSDATAKVERLFADTGIEILALKGVGIEKDCDLFKDGVKRTAIYLDMTVILPV